ncbi:hypothetical protein QR98_0105140 [Sarcoptes scabiei]|uniref:Uncharacterized protein n=1 Tax=Sarcoptes scabiei TaxID=52283 RepID=A0A132AMP8_SARSC|nr:hypothetical protein QR98_0105140 [Sarcoptes scabiei]
MIVVEDSIDSNIDIALSNLCGSEHFPPLLIINNTSINLCSDLIVVDCCDWINIDCEDNDVLDNGKSYDGIVQIKCVYKDFNKWGDAKIENFPKSNPKIK